ncbi:hypothetical protein, partial [Acetobacterium malicum]|uniref:hypothetical protein n=1 Tax=Acetobacterium malicum TaxID=52692 RepID=UPI001A9BAC1D
VHLSVSILASFILADVSAVLQVLWYYSLFYDRRFLLKKLFYYTVAVLDCQVLFQSFFWRRHPDLNWG